MQAEQVLTADYTVSDEPLPIDNINGLREGIERVQDAEAGSEFVRCEDRVMDYRVYWNEKTESVRIGAVAMLASYEIDESTPTLGDYDE